MKLKATKSGKSFIWRLLLSVCCLQSLAGEPIVRQINGVAVPSDFPQISANQFSANTAPGRLFFGSTFMDGRTGNYLIICEHDGTPYFYRKFGKDAEGRGSGEFHLQANGLLTAHLFGPEIYIAFDTTFTIIDTFRCQNGYDTDSHEMQLLPEGHALLIAKELRTVDMSQLVSGGSPRASVLGNHVQELDENKNVVFEWLCWDHLNIADAVHENLRGSYIDYVHMNAVAVDFDGHLVISSRHLSEITKIHRQTGEIIWRLGGVHNQFTFMNDDIEISYQHHVRPVPGKPNSYTLFDNGNFRTPQFSRAVEYKLDPDNKTAEKTWEFRRTPDRYSGMMGSVQRLPNLNTFINWSTWPPLLATEVDENGNLLYEIRAQGVSSNRVRRFEWSGVARKPMLMAEPRNDGVVLIFNKFGDKMVDRYVVYGGTSPENLVPMDSTSNTFAFLTALENSRRYYFRVQAVLKNGERSEFSDPIDLLVNISPSGENLLINGNFSGENGWAFSASEGAHATGAIADGAFFVDITNGGGEYQDVQLAQANIPLIQGRTYRLEFDARASVNKVIEAKLAPANDDGRNYSQTAPVVLRRAESHFTFEFVMADPTDAESRLLFNCGGSDIDCYFDNVSLAQVVETEVSENNTTRLAGFYLAQNYPNPFNAGTTIRYNLTEACDVRLTIRNLLGQVTAEWLLPEQTAGEHNLAVDAATWASGIYFYQLEATSSAVGSIIFVETKKMLILK